MSSPKQCCKMNKYFPPKPLAKDLSVVKKTVRKGSVWSQARSAVQCSSSRGTPRCVSTIRRWNNSMRRRGNQQNCKMFLFRLCLTNVKCNCCICFGSGAVITTGLLSSIPLGWTLASMGSNHQLRDFPLKYILK